MNAGQQAMSNTTGRLPVGINIVSIMMLIFGVLSVPIPILMDSAAREALIQHTGSEQEAIRQVTLACVLTVSQLVAGIFLRRLKDWAYWVAVGHYGLRILSPLLFPVPPMPDMQSGQGLSATVLSFLVSVVFLIVLAANYHSYMEAAKASQSTMPSDSITTATPSPAQSNAAAQQQRTVASAAQQMSLTTEDEKKREETIAFRRRYGHCILCGKDLSFSDKMSGRAQHAGCDTFRG
jgi:hypothetical protein